MELPPHGQTDAIANRGDFDSNSDDFTWQQVSDYFARPQSQVALILLVFIVTRLWWLLAFEATGQDTYHYAEIARRGVDCNDVAYRDFAVEYPPVALWLMESPRLFDSDRYPDSRPLRETMLRYAASYLRWFHAELLLADMICLGLMFLIGWRISATALWVLPTAYTLLTMAQPHLIYDRLDIGLMMFFLLFIFCWLTADFGERGRAANRWAPDLWGGAAYLFLGLGISFKIMPVIFVPFLLLADVWAAGSAWRFSGRVLALAVGAAGPFLVHIPSAAWDVFQPFQYHSERGIQMESIWGSMMLVASAFGVPCHVILSHAAFDLEGDWSSTLKIVSSVGMLAAAACFGLWALLRGRRFDRRLALDTAILVLVNSTVLAHVFSPQYLNWLLPLALLLALNIFPRSFLPWCGFATLVVAIVAISSWLFPYGFKELVTLQTWPVVVSMARSACLVGLAMLLNICFLAKYGLVPWQTESRAREGLVVAA
jgi:hypothetical protein